MYQVNYKASYDNKTFGDNRSVITGDLDKTLEYILSEKDFVPSDITVIENAFGSLAEANMEIQRLRKLLAQAYGELQQLKGGYNEYIQKEKAVTSNTSLGGNLENVQLVMDLEDTTTTAVQDVPGEMEPDEKNINPNDLSFFFVYQRENSVVFWIRVNGKIDAKNRIEIPKEDFHSPACVLDFNDAEITDDCRTVRFGQYECSVESVLEYKYNPDKYVEEEK